MNMMTAIKVGAPDAALVEAALRARHGNSGTPESPEHVEQPSEGRAMETLPPHVATNDEPIPPLGESSGDAPDMRTAASIEQMLAWLHEEDPVDDVAYLKLWQAMVRSIGMSVLICYERGGEESLMFGVPCDAQMRHRHRWMHFLFADLEQVRTRRELLMMQLRRSGPSCDKRRRDPRATTRAVREFLAVGGRLLITPQGHLEDKGIFSDLHDVLAYQRNQALETYCDVRRRFRSDSQIKRAVRMIGTRTDNGWIILERKEH